MHRSSSGGQLQRWSEQLASRGLAHTLSASGRVRLVLCSALRAMLREAAGCEAVAEDMLEGPCTHAQAVEQAAAQLASGQNEGLVLVSATTAGRASLRKWKNSAEGCSVSRKHAEQLRKVGARALVEDGRLDERVAVMVETLIAVAEAETTPLKVGRSKFNPARATSMSK